MHALHVEAVLIKRLPHAADLPIPTRATVGAAGVDLCAALSRPVMLLPKEWEAIPTGFCIQLPDGVEGQVRPRSGLALKKGIGILNTPGTLDPDYRGEIKVVLVNHSEEAFVVNHGDRIAQLVFVRFLSWPFVEVEALSPSERGAAGFGSTGTAVPSPQTHRVLS